MRHPIRRTAVLAGAVAVTLGSAMGIAAAAPQSPAGSHHPAPALSLTKIAEPTTFTGPGEHITYHYTVTNDSRRLVVLPVVVDSQFGIVRCRTNLLLPGRRTICGPRTLTTTSTDVTDGQISNTAFARGLGGARSAPVTVTVHLAQAAVSHLYWANTGGGTIMRANLNGTGVTTLVSHQDFPFGVAVDSSHIYWADSGTDTIMRANLDGTDVTTLVGQAGLRPLGMAVNSSHVYWTTSGVYSFGIPGQLREANLNGGDVNTLLPIGFLTGGLAVDSIHIYWADSVTGRIVRANLDGTGRTLLFRFAQANVEGLAVSSSHIYWAVGGDPELGVSGTIMEATLSGHLVTTLVRGQEAPSGVAVDSQHIYWTDVGEFEKSNGTIMEANLNGTGVTTLVTGQDFPARMAVGP